MSGAPFSLFRRRVTITREKPVPEPEKKTVCPEDFVYRHYTFWATLPRLSDRIMLCEICNRYSRHHLSGYYEVFGRVNPWERSVSLLGTSNTSPGYMLARCEAVGYVFTDMDPRLQVIWDEYRAKKEKEK